MREELRGILAGILLLGLPVAANAQATIGAPLMGGSGEFGVDDDWPVYTYGQTFTVPTLDAVLDRFSLWLGWGANTDQLLFSAYLMEWDGAAPTGEILYRSDRRQGPGPNAIAIADYARYDFQTGGLQLTPGQTYMMFISAGEHLADMPAEAWGFVGTTAQDRDYYADGTRVHYYNNQDVAYITGEGRHGWQVWGYDDLAFEAQFSAGSTVTPEPVSMALLGTGLAGLGALRRRRRKSVPS